MRLADLGTQVAYRVSGGRVGERQLSYSVLLLCTVGRRSGKTRTHALLYIRDGGDFVVCASNYGSHHYPAWYLNLHASPEARIQVGPKVYTVRARVAEGSERGRLWQKFLAVRPQYTGYQRHTSREFPVIILTPVSSDSRGSDGEQCI